MSEAGIRPADVVDGLHGAARMLAAFATPGRRHRRSITGATEEEASRSWPGDDIVPTPRWGWHHAIEIAASVSEVWPWLVQIGADRGGFYSYEALENLVGCRLHNADRVHPEWQSLAVGDGLVIHPKMPPLPIMWLEANRGFAAGARLELPSQRPVPLDRALPRDHLAVSWLFVLEQLGPKRSRFASRYRVSYGRDPKTRLSMGPALIEPIGTVMDQRMLRGIRERVEHARLEAAAP